MDINLQQYLEMAIEIDNALKERLLQDNGRNTPFAFEISDAHGHLVAVINRLEQAIKKQTLEG